jgi:hypothetical protein
MDDMVAKKIGPVATPKIPQMADAPEGIVIYYGTDGLSTDPCGCPQRCLQ